MTRPTYFLFLFCLLINSQLFAQTPLQLSDAIVSTLQNNYAMKLAKARLKLAENDNTSGNAGMLPTVSGQVLKNYSVNNLNQTFFPAGGTVRDPLSQNGVINNNGNVGVGFVWTLYDGMGMYITRDRLGKNVAFGQEGTQIMLNNIVAQVSNAFYDITRQQQRIKTFNKALEISTERTRLAKDRYEVGQGSKQDYLSAQVDYNADKAALLAQEQLLQSAKITLNTLMLKDLQDDFVVQDTILLDKTIIKNDIRQSMLAYNPALLQANINKQMAALDTKNMQSLALPQVDLLSGINYNSVNNGAGFGVKNGQSTNLNLGLRATINIFDGYNQKRRVSAAKINENVADLQEKDLRLQLEAMLERTYLSYKNGQILLDLEIQNYVVAKQNVSIAFERYKIGVATSLELREAQRNAVATETRLTEAEFNTKLAEIELNRLAGKLIMKEN